MGVKYSVNGKYFNFFGVHVSESKGLLDKLKPRERKSYEWAEYDGRQIDLSSPKYEAREISLSCWIKADNIDLLTESFNLFMSEFDKSGTQRLIIEPFNYKPYVFDVILNNGSELEKEFRDGDVYGSFNLSLLEPNPVKKVLFTELNSIDVSFIGKGEYDINIDGVNTVGKDTITFTKTLTPRVIQSKDNYGRNLFVGDLNLFASDFPNASTREKGKITVLTDGKFNAYTFINPTVRVKNGEKYSSSIEVRFNGSFSDLKVFVFYEYSTHLKTIQVNTLTPGEWHRLENISEPILDTNKQMLVSIEGTGVAGSTIEYRKFKLEMGDNPTEWSLAPESMHYVVIAGNINEIIDFDTNAEVLWSKI